MGRLIHAEFRKILTTHLWWSLLVAAAVVSFGWSLVAGLVATGFGDALRDSEALRQSGDTFQDLPLGVFAIARGINITTLFPMLFGALGLASELHRRTITTSFLTASSRSAMLTAKAVTYAVWGLIFGVVISALSILGTIAGTGGKYLPDLTGSLLLFGGGVLASALWTLFGLGIGALMGSPLAVVLSLVLYTVLAEPVFDLFLHNHVAGALPNGSADGMTGSTAAQLIVDQLQTRSDSPLVQAIGQDQWNEFLAIVHNAADATGTFDWWLSALIFAAWAGAFFVLGMARNRTRDIT